MDDDIGSQYADRLAEDDWERENNKCLGCERKLDNCICDEEDEL